MIETTADLVGRQLPYLRRFSRALNGSQEHGDAYVVAMLEMLVADPGILKRNLPAKTSVYQLFMHIWNSIPINQQSDPVAFQSNGGVVEKRIETLTPRPRQAFLLAALEEFSTSEIATILECSEDEVRELVDAASREIAAQIGARVLIIEDEPMIAFEIESLVTEIGHEVVGIATTRREATELARLTKPGLILADIQLGDGSSGIDAANEILEDMTLPLIFITAYPERLLTGDQLEPTFLVTKPFRPEMVKALISQALFFDLNAGVPQRAAQNNQAKSLQ
jgi:CheY-like chemotaxis protein